MKTFKLIKNTFLKVIIAACATICFNIKEAAAMKRPAELPTEAIGEAISPTKKRKVKVYNADLEKEKYLGLSAIKEKRYNDAKKIFLGILIKKYKDDENLKTYCYRNIGRAEALLSLSQPSTAIFSPDTNENLKDWLALEKQAGIYLIEKAKKSETSFNEKKTCYVKAFKIFLSIVAAVSKIEDQAKKNKYHNEYRIHAYRNIGQIVEFFSNNQILVTNEPSIEAEAVIDDEDEVPYTLTELFDPSTQSSSSSPSFNE